MTRVIIIMGVSGSGKSTIGKMLAHTLELPFFDGDDYHPEENKIKMSSGIPLNDEDRFPWLTRLHDIAVHHISGKGCVIACSALKETYRQLLMKEISDQVTWIFLEGEYNQINERIHTRQGHYMKASMLQSQLDTLQRPEYAICISIEHEPEFIVHQILTQLES